MDRRWYPCYYDDEHGKTSWRDEAGYPEGFCCLDGAPFKAFAANRDEWALTTSYVYPGPIQYFGPTEVCDQPTKTLQLEQSFNTDLYII